MKKRGLIVEGGGMRGAHSCGVLMALAESGLTSFDVVAATSAGACTAAFLVSGQPQLLPLIWTQYLHGNAFINFKNILKEKSVMDLDYLIDDVFCLRQPLDIAGLQKSTTDFYITATHCGSGKATYFHNRRDPILKALKASSAIPIAYRQPVIIDGQPYLDGGLSDPIPIQKAIDAGCEEIYVVLTRPEGYRKKVSLVNILPRFFEKKYPRLSETILQRHILYNDTVEKLEKGYYPGRIHIIRPGQKLPVRRLTTKLGRIKAAVALGYQDGLRVLTASHGLTSRPLSLKMGS